MKMKARKKVKAIGNAANRRFSDHLLNVIGGDILTGGAGTSPYLEIPSYKGKVRGDAGFECVPIADKVTPREMAEVVRVIRKGCATEFKDFTALRNFVRDEFGLKDCDVCIAFGDEMLGWFFEHDIYHVYSLKPKEYRIDPEMEAYIGGGMESWELRIEN